jgi:dihydroorotate dehydrogenase
MVKMIDFFYQSGTMGFYGEGYFWHKFYKFPNNFPVVSKTITLYKNKGLPFTILPLGDSVWNKYGLHNDGMGMWLKKYADYVERKYYKQIDICSISGSFPELSSMIHTLSKYYNIRALEINLSCPNSNTDYDDIDLEKLFSKMDNLTDLTIYLKVRYDFDVERIKGLPVKRIHLNSVPGRYIGSWSGKKAQELNWGFIENYQGKPDIPEIAGVSWVRRGDIHKLFDMGCKTFGIGSVILTNPKLVESLNFFRKSLYFNC